MSVKWDLSAQGVEEIRKVERSLANCVESLKQCTDTLTSAWDSSKDRLGALGDSLDNALSLMKANNDVCEESATAMGIRIEQYAQQIEAFLDSSSQEEIGSGQGNPTQAKTL